MITGGSQGKQVEPNRCQDEGQELKNPNLHFSVEPLSLEKLFGNNSQEPVVGPYCSKQGRQH